MTDINVEAESDGRARGANLGYRPEPCSACPWLTRNHGREHPDGWYDEENLNRLWDGMRTGEAPGMTCHPTDPANPAPSDRPQAHADDGADFHECTGYHALMQRELMLFEGFAEESEEGDDRVGDAWSKYVAATQFPGCTKEGLLTYGIRPMPPIMGGVGIPHGNDVREVPVSRPQRSKPSHVIDITWAEANAMLKKMMLSLQKARSNMEELEIGDLAKHLDEFDLCGDQGDELLEELSWMIEDGDVTPFQLRMKVELFLHEPMIAMPGVLNGELKLPEKGERYEYWIDGEGEL